jgi:5-methyltetrahydrofolate--homocysteine methyltransferase
MVDLGKFIRAFFDGDQEEVKGLIQQALDQGEDADAILKLGLQKAMEHVGLKFRNDEIYIPEVLVAAQTMHAGLDVLKPILSKGAASKGPKVVLGTVKSDIHDIGKNLVGMMLEGGGFEVIDIGTNAPAEKFVQVAQENDAEMIAMSALLTTTMPGIQATIEAVKAADLDMHVKTIVGGAPVTEEYARQVGADGYAPEAGSAVEKAKELLGLKS